MSKRCRANTMLYFTRRFSNCCCSCSVKIEFSHCKLARKALRCWSSAVGSNFSSAPSLVISSYNRLSIRFSFDGSSHVSGVGYQRRSVCLLEHLVQDIGGFIWTFSDQRELFIRHWLQVFCFIGSHYPECSHCRIRVERNCVAG